MCKPITKTNKMKNIHLIPTGKPSRFYKTNTFDWGFSSYYLNDDRQTMKNYNIYITSDEKINVGDWVISIEGIWKNTIIKITGVPIADVWKKIILTTDQDLINDGVQTIDDKFLEWFVKNPSCEEVKIESWQTKGEWDLDYKIIIPKEEPKQVLCGKSNTTLVYEQND